MLGLFRKPHHRFVNGKFALIPVIVLCKFIEVNSTLTLTWFGCVVTVMFLEHFRRVKLLQLPNICA